MSDQPPRSTQPSVTPEEFDRCFELSQDLLCVAGSDGYFRHLTRSGTTLLDYTVTELCAEPFENFLHPDDRNGPAQQSGDQVARGLKGVQFINRYRHSDGSYPHPR